MVRSQAIEREKRRRARAGWPVRHGRQDDPERVNLAATTSVAERLEMVAELSETAWSLFPGRASVSPREVASVCRLGDQNRR
jgi:hypothetical protein